MISFERRQRLLVTLKEHPGIRVPELSKLLDVSEGTVRNDLTALSELGQLTRVRGGAQVIDENKAQNAAFTARAEVNTQNKQNIARKAAELIKDGDSVLFDASSTVYHLAHYLHDRRNLRIITNGIEVGKVLSQNPYNTVILVGGLLSSDGNSITGLVSDFFLKDLHVNKAFVSCSGFTVKEGLTEVHIHEVQLKRRMIDCASEVIALIDSHKFGKIDLTLFAQPNQVNHLFTDGDIKADWIRQLTDAEIPFTVCNNDAQTNF
ncbi:MAG: DeoR/GlpR family DNA-binding transcription regulator [Anaerolineae bacterium]|nr:DeoR/GlpR family DNA-binding transcription regulator [Anaerolineae bacterium]